MKKKSFDIMEIGKAVHLVRDVRRNINLAMLSVGEHGNGVFTLPWLEQHFKPLRSYEDSMEWIEDVLPRANDYVLLHTATGALIQLTEHLYALARCFHALKNDATPVYEAIGRTTAAKIIVGRQADILGDTFEKERVKE